MIYKPHPCCTEFLQFSINQVVETECLGVDKAYKGPLSKQLGSLAFLVRNSYFIKHRNRNLHIYNMQQNSKCNVHNVHCKSVAFNFSSYEDSMFSSSFCKKTDPKVQHNS